MDFELDNKVYELHKEPTFGAVEQVIEFDQSIMLSCINLADITEDDKKRDINELVQERLLAHPEAMAKYMAKQQLAEHYRTVMLCTGMCFEVVQLAPLLPLYEECVRVMGGTASDFFERFQKSSASKKTRTTRVS